MPRALRRVEQGRNLLGVVANQREPLSDFDGWLTPPPLLDNEPAAQQAVATECPKP